MTDTTTQSTAQIAASTAVQTLQALLPTLLVGAASSSGLTAPETAVLTLLPTFVQMAESLKASGSMTDAQLTAAWAVLGASVQSDSDRLRADLAKLGIAPLPTIFQSQAA